MNAQYESRTAGGAHARRRTPASTLSYTPAGAHAQVWLDLTEQLLETGVDSIAIKDMSAMLTPMAAYERCQRNQKRFWCACTCCHATTGMAEMALLRPSGAGFRRRRHGVSSMSTGTDLKRWWRRWRVLSMTPGWGYPEAGKYRRVLPRVRKIPC